MKFCAALILAVLTVANSVRLKTEEHPIVGVISLVNKLKAEALAEGESEALAYEKYVHSCGQDKATLTKAIDEEDTAIDSLTDKIDAKTALIASLKKEIETLETEYLENEATLTAQQKARDSENGLYIKKSADLKQTISAIGEALVALGSAQNKTESGLLQVEKVVRSAMALVQLSGKAPPTLAAHVDKYDFKSESVIELFKKLESEFQEELLATEQAETNALNSFALSKKSIDNMQAANTKSKATKSQAKTDAEKDLNTAKDEKRSQEADKEADTETLDTRTKACQTKKEEWEKRSKTREDEVAAMDVAVKILSKATGVRTEAPANPVPPTAPASFLQLASMPTQRDRESQAVAQATNLLLTTAKGQHSTMLKQLAVEVRAKLSAPYDNYTFQPVINMIEKMIFRLQEEQKAEDDHKMWCDKELEKTTIMKTDKTDTVMMKTAKKEEEVGKIGELNVQIMEANQMISSIKTFQAEATEIRTIGAKENKLALKDAQSAQAAVSDAIAVLTEFYKSSGMIEKEKYEFVQEPVSLPASPKTWDSEYTGVTDPKEQPKGIIAVLEEVSKDFALMESETKTQEAEDQKAYDDEMSKMDIEKARRTQEVEEKTLEKSHRVSVVAELTSELKHTGSELKKTEQYLLDLEKACVAGDSTYDARKAARLEEEKGLRQAETILNEAFKSEEGSKFLQVHRH